MPEMVISSMTDERLVALANNRVIAAEFFVKDSARIHYRPIPNPANSMRPIPRTCGKDSDLVGLPTL